MNSELVFSMFRITSFSRSKSKLDNHHHDSKSFLCIPSKGFLPTSSLSDCPVHLFSLNDLHFCVVAIISTTQRFAGKVLRFQFFRQFFPAYFQKSTTTTSTYAWPLLYRVQTNLPRSNQSPMKNSYLFPNPMICMPILLFYQQFH